MGLRRKAALVPFILAIVHPVFTGTAQPLPTVLDCPCGFCPDPLFPPSPCFPSQGPLSLPVSISAAASEVEGLCRLPSLETPPCSLPKFCLISLPSFRSEGCVHPVLPLTLDLPLHRSSVSPNPLPLPGTPVTVGGRGPGLGKGIPPRRCAWEGAGS